MRSWMVIAKMLSLPAPRLAREMRRCVQVSLEGEDGHGGLAIARRVTLLRSYLMHPLWPSRHSASQHGRQGGKSPAWLLPGLPREWLRAREFAEWVELAVGLYTLKADPAGLVTLAAEGKGSAGSKATSALARWEVLREGHGEAAAAMEGSWWKDVAEDAAGTNPLVLLPRLELEGWAWMQGRALDRELNGHMALQKQQRTLVTRVLLAWAGNALPGPRPGGPQGPLFPVLETDRETAATRADETGRPLMARLSYARLGARRIISRDLGAELNRAGAGEGGGSRSQRGFLRLEQGDDESRREDPLLHPSRARRVLRRRASVELEALVSPLDAVRAYCRFGRFVRACDLARYFNSGQSGASIGRARQRAWQRAGMLTYGARVRALYLEDGDPTGLHAECSGELSGSELGSARGED